MLVGRNGVGKTTLLKALLADAPGLPPSPGDIDGGTVRWGHEVSIGYFPQDHTGAIEKGMTAVEWLHQFDPDASRQDIHGLLGQMLFSGEEGLKPTEALSGGETARLLFCRIMLQKPNVLVLDEPTNHLDLESINALNVALQKFEGTVLLVTHDQDLMEEVGTRVWHFDDGTIDGLQGHLRGVRGDTRLRVGARAFRHSAPRACPTTIQRGAIVCGNGAADSELLVCSCSSRRLDVARTRLRQRLTSWSRPAGGAPCCACSRPAHTNNGTISSAHLVTRPRVMPGTSQAGYRRLPPQIKVFLALRAGIDYIFGTLRTFQRSPGGSALR